MLVFVSGGAKVPRIKTISMRQPLVVITQWQPGCLSVCHHPCVSCTPNLGLLICKVRTILPLASKAGCLRIKNKTIHMKNTAQYLAHKCSIKTIIQNGLVIIGKTASKIAEQMFGSFPIFRFNFKISLDTYDVMRRHCFSVKKVKITVKGIPLFWGTAASPKAQEFKALWWDTPHFLWTMRQTLLYQ